jgi:hypothetical protein
MLDIALVSVAVMAGAVAVAGVPLRCWQLASGRLRARIPAHPIAQTTFTLFSAVFFAPAALAWAYALYAAYRDFGCTGACAQAGVGTAIALGLLGCAYGLLEGFLLTARRRIGTATGDSGLATHDR